MFKRNNTENKWLILASVCAVFFMLNISWIMVNLALPSMVTTLHFSAAQTQWVMTGYAIAAAMFMVVGGRFADLFGYRRVYVCGMVLYALASLFACLAMSPVFLITARVIQGLAVAITFPVANILVIRSFTSAQRGLAIGLIVTAVSIAETLGPLVAGFVLKYLSWHWIFLIGTLIGMLAIVLFYSSGYHGDAIAQSDIRKRRIDYGGALFLAIGIFLFIFGANEFHHVSASVIASTTMILGAIAIALFTVYEMKSSSPLFDVRTFKNTTYSVFTSLRAMSQYVHLSLIFILVLFMRNIIGFTALQSGMLLMLVTGAPGAIAPFAGKWTDRVGVRKPVMLGLLLLTVSYISLYFSSPAWSIGMFVGPLLVVGLALGIMQPATITGALCNTSKDKATASAGMFFTNALLGAAIGITVSSLLLDRRSAFYLSKMIASHKWQFTHVELTNLYQSAKGLMPVSHLHNLHAVAAKYAYTHAFREIILICILVNIVAFMLTFLLPNKKQQHCVIDNNEK